MKLRWILLLVAGYVAIDYLQDGNIDGSLLRSLLPLHIPILPIFGVNKLVAATTIKVKKLYRIQDGTYEIDMRATLKRLGKRKDHHHKHES